MYGTDMCMVQICVWYVCLYYTRVVVQDKE